MSVFTVVFQFTPQNQFFSYALYPVKETPGHLVDVSPCSRSFFVFDDGVIGFQGLSSILASAAGCVGRDGA